MGTYENPMTVAGGRRSGLECPRLLNRSGRGVILVRGLNVVGVNPRAAGADNAKAVVVDICRQRGDLSMSFP